MNNKVETYFFELLQVAVGNRDSLSCAPTAEEWEEIYEISKKQTLVGIAFKGVERLPQEQLPPAKRVRQWYVKADKIKHLNNNMNMACAKMCFMMKKAGFHSCIIKGQANLKNYGSSKSPLNGDLETTNSEDGREGLDLGWFRTPGDIDIWVWSDSGKVSDVIRFFTARQADAEPYFHHMDCNIMVDIETEVHYRPSWMSAPWRNKILQRFCNEHKGDIQHFPVQMPNDKYSFFYAPSGEFDVVYQLVHIYRHLFNEGIGLRQILDYYMVLRPMSTSKGESVSSATSASYREEAMKILSDLGMRDFARAMMWVLQEVFEGGSPLPSHKGERPAWMLCDPNEKLGRFLLSEIMLAGNFGHSDERYTITREESAAKWGIMKLRRNLKFLTQYPEEVLCEPLFRVYHWAWRTWRLWRY